METEAGLRTQSESARVCCLRPHDPFVPSPSPVSDFGLTHLADAKVRQAQRILAEKHRRWAETSLATLGRQNFDTLGTEELVNSGSPLLGDVEDASLGLL